MRCRVDGPFVQPAIQERAGHHAGLCRDYLQPAEAPAFDLNGVAQSASDRYWFGKLVLWNSSGVQRPDQMSANVLCMQLSTVRPSQELTSSSTQKLATTRPPPASSRARRRISLQSRSACSAKAARVAGSCVQASEARRVWPEEHDSQYSGGTHCHVNGAWAAGWESQPDASTWIIVKVGAAAGPRPSVGTVPCVRAKTEAQSLPG